MTKLKYSILISESKQIKIIDNYGEKPRTYQRVFGLREPISEMVEQYLFKHVESVKRLSLFQCKLRSYSLIRIINRFMNITHLIVDNVDVVDKWATSKGSNIYLPKLDHIEIINSDLTDFFAKSPEIMRKLKSLKVDLALSPTLLRKTSPNLTMKATRLEKLTVNKDAILFIRKVLDYPFKLRKLSMGHMYERELRSEVDLPVEFQYYLPNDRLIRFLSKQANTLKELAVYNCPKTRMLNFIVSRLKVEKLSLGISALDYDKNLFKGIAVNKHLKELNFHGEMVLPGQWVAVKQIIEQFPSIECLKFYNSKGEAARFIEIISSLLKIKVSIVKSHDNYFNSIKNTEFYIKANNCEEFEIMMAGKDEAENRIKRIREEEEKEALREEFKKVGK